MRKLVPHLVAFVLGSCVLACLVLSAGCASPATSKAMTLTEFKPVKVHPFSVLVQVEGGNEADPGFNMPGISSDAFREALVATVEGSRIFAAVKQQPPADYRLNVSIVQAKPKGALTARTLMAARWKLTRLSDDKGVFDEFIESNGKGKAFTGVARLRKSLECAGRENIKLGLTSLSQLELR